MKATFVHQYQKIRTCVKQLLKAKSKRQQVSRGRQDWKAITLLSQKTQTVLSMTIEKLTKHE